MLHPPVRLHGTFHVTRLYAYVRVPATVAQIRNAQRAEKHAHRTTSTAILALFDRFVLNVVLGCVFVRVNFPSLRFAHARGSPTARQWQAVGGALLRRRSAGSAAQPRCRRYRDLFDRFVLDVVLGRVLVRVNFSVASLRSRSGLADGSQLAGIRWSAASTTLSGQRGSAALPPISRPIRSVRSERCARSRTRSSAC